MVEYSIGRSLTHVTLAVLAITVLMSVPPCNSQLNLLDTILGLVGRGPPPPSPPPSPSPSPPPAPASPPPPPVTTTTTTTTTTTKAPKIKTKNKNKRITTPAPDSSSESEDSPEEVKPKTRARGRGFTDDDDHITTVAPNDSGSYSESDSGSDEGGSDKAPKAVASAERAAPSPDTAASPPERFDAEGSTLRPLLPKPKIGRRRRSIFWPYEEIAVAH